MVQLTSSDFHARVETSAILVVEFLPERLAAGLPHPLSGKFPDVTFAQVDPGREPAIADMFGLACAPALLIFREGVALYLEPAEHSRERIAGLLDRISTLDMAQIRASIEAERSKTAVHMRRMCPAARRGPLNQ